MTHLPWIFDEDILQSQNVKNMFLVNWFQANALMLFTVLVLFGIPLVVMLIAFGGKKKKSGGDAV